MGYIGDVCSICIKIFQLRYINNNLAFLDKGCKFEGVWSCLNGGTCNSNGMCICKNGFSGLTCSICTVNKIKTFDII